MKHVFDHSTGKEGKTINVLILEDSDERITTLVNKCDNELKNAIVTAVDTADDCIQELREGYFDLVFLDHDLGMEGDTGMKVANFLEISTQLTITVHYIIHSMNAPAAERMYNKIRNSSLIPFNELVTVDLKELI